MAGDQFNLRRNQQLIYCLDSDVVKYEPELIRLSDTGIRVLKVWQFFGNSFDEVVGELTFLNDETC